MKAISLWQPWASLVVAGSKKIETRCWSTNYRGPLLIHAAKRINKNELMYYLCCWNFTYGLEKLDVHMGAGYEVNKAKLPFGAIIGKANLIDCRPTGSFTIDELDSVSGEGHKTWTERSFGNFEQGRFGWVFDNPVMFEKPIPYKGSQGFFHVDPSLIPGEAVVA